jgi:hypothetical protein
MVLPLSKPEHTAPDADLPVGRDCVKSRRKEIVLCTREPRVATQLNLCIARAFERFVRAIRRSAPGGSYDNRDNGQPLNCSVCMLNTHSQLLPVKLTDFSCGESTLDRPACSDKPYTLIYGVTTQQRS